MSNEQWKRVFGKQHKLIMFHRMVILAKLLDYSSTNNSFYHKAVFLHQKYCIEVVGEKLDIRFSPTKSLTNYHNFSQQMCPRRPALVRSRYPMDQGPSAGHDPGAPAVRVPHRPVLLAVVHVVRQDWRLSAV